MEQDIRRAAAAMREHSRRSVKFHTKESQFAVVRRLDPLAIELTESRLSLDEDELHIGQGVRKYDNDFGLKEGDSVLVVPIGSGDYLVSEVVSEKKDFEGADTNPVMGAGYLGGGSDTVSIPSGGGTDTVSWQGTPIVGTVPFYDKDGKVIGRLPLLPP